MRYISVIKKTLYFLLFIYCPFVFAGTVSNIQSAAVFNTLTEALDAVEDNQTLHLYPGIYRETVNITASGISLIGKDWLENGDNSTVVVDFIGETHGLSFINQSGIRIQGISFVNADNIGFYAVSTTDLLITHCHFEGHGGFAGALWLIGSHSGTKIISNSFVANSVGISMEGDDMNGITIAYNRFFDNSSRAMVIDANAVLTAHNIFRANTTAIRLDDRAEGEIFNNIFYENSAEAIDSIQSETLNHVNYNFFKDNGADIRDNSVLQGEDNLFTGTMKIDPIKWQILSSESVLVNAGTNIANLSPVIQGAATDIGLDEFEFPLNNYISIQPDNIANGEAISGAFIFTGQSFNALSGFDPISNTLVFDLGAEEFLGMGESWFWSNDTTVLNDGQDYTYDWIAYDNTGTVITNRYMHLVDNSPPVLTMTSHSENDVVANIAKLSGSIDDPHSSIQRVDVIIKDSSQEVLYQAQAEVENSNWSTDWNTGDLEPGDYRITVIGQNDAGLWVTNTTIVNRPEAPQILNIITYAGDYLAGEVDFLGRVLTDSNAEPITNYISIDSGAFSQFHIGTNIHYTLDSDLYSEGFFEMSFLAVNRFGQSNTVDLEMFVANDGTSGDITNIENGDNFFGKIHVLGTNDNSPAPVVSTHLRLFQGSTTFVYHKATALLLSWEAVLEIDGLTTGNYQLESIHSNLAGSVYTNTAIDIAIDAAPPYLQVDSPVAEEILMGTEVFRGGFSNAIISDSWTEAWIVYGKNQTNAISTSNWVSLVDTRTLTNGPNEFSFYTVSENNITNEQVQHYLVDNTPVRFRLANFHEDIVLASNLVIRGSAIENETEITFFRLSIYDDLGNVLESGDLANDFTYNLFVDKYENDQYGLQLFASNSAGHSSRSSVYRFYIVRENFAQEKEDFSVSSVNAMIEKEKRFYNCNEQSRIYIFNTLGELKRTLGDDPGEYHNHKQEIIWDLKDQAGYPLPAGIYWIDWSQDGTMRGTRRKAVLLTH